MTEDDAKTKTCPQKDHGVDPCIASECMAWRWSPLMANTPEYIEALKTCENERGMKHRDAAIYVNTHRAEFGLPTKPFSGYCGLAGKPEVE